MGGLSLLTLLITMNLSDEEIMAIFERSVNTLSEDREEVKGFIRSRVVDQYRNLTKHDEGISTTIHQRSGDFAEVINETYRAFGKHNQAQQGQQYANIVLVGSVDQPVSLGLIHTIHDLIADHNENMGNHPCKYRLVVTDLVEMAIL